MKKACLLLMLTSLLFSCKKNDNSPKELVNGRCRISCTISGAFNSNYQSQDAFSFTAVSKALNPLDNTLVCESLWKNDASGAREEVWIYVKESTKQPGTYHFTDPSASEMFVQVLRKNIYTNVDTTWSAIAGDDFTLNITKIDYFEIEGTFSGTLKGKQNTSKNVTVSNGKFRGLFNR
ncbi:MAG: hypothetical protein U0T11_06185 [Chitinophagaceae bacterium]